MSDRKNVCITFGFTLSVSLIVSAFVTVLASYQYSSLQFDMLNAICGRVLEQKPDAEVMIASTLKEYVAGNLYGTAERNVLSELGYQAGDFSFSLYHSHLVFVLSGLVIGTILLAGTFWHRNRKEAVRIRGLADYLEKVYAGKPAVLSACEEDEFSKLEDAIYKTVTFLYRTKEAAIEVKNDYADNLSNIAHQIKTPITAISLLVQSMQREYHSVYIEQIQKQILRLERLEEALLVLARLDAGVLNFEREKIDVFTILSLAADNLQELLEESDTKMDIPELGELAVTADLEWTMEAVANLMKNCMEHNPGGTIHCSYGQNTLYTEILIWDEGIGFAKEDIPHLFERFYRGQNAREGGIGIGLALSKEIIERQNGTIRARNMPERGACFEIRLYRH